MSLGDDKKEELFFMDIFHSCSSYFSIQIRGFV